MGNRVIELVVGMFLITAMLALVFLAFNTSGRGGAMPGSGMTLVASFDEIGSLRENAPVRIAGVTIGHVQSIALDVQQFKAKVQMQINGTPIPVDSSAAISTEGLLGSQYISISPGFEAQFLKEGGRITRTQSALILEQLIGQLVFRFTGTNQASGASKTSQTGQNE